MYNSITCDGGLFRSPASWLTLLVSWRFDKIWQIGRKSKTPLHADHCRNRPRKPLRRIWVFEKAKARGIKPITGCELYVTPTLKLEKPSGGKNYHLIVLFMNEQGYRNLSLKASTNLSERNSVASSIRVIPVSLNFWGNLPCKILSTLSLMLSIYAPSICLRPLFFHIHFYLLELHHPYLLQ